MLYINAQKLFGQVSYAQKDSLNLNYKLDSMDTCLSYERKINQWNVKLIKPNLVTNDSKN